VTAALDQVDAAVGAWLAERRGQPLILGLCGAQGSGKSTLAAALHARVADRGLASAIVSLDDLYLSGKARAALAATVHPLLRTRGVPLTHDVAHGLSLIDAVRDGRAVRLPRFDKARDEPEPETRWTAVPAGLDLLILEGWCVGARCQDEAALATPVNSLERDEDASGVWRGAVNAALRTGYTALFARLDRLVLLAAPGFDVVARWRLEQENALRRARAAAGLDAGGLMDAAAVECFVRHYERLTRWILAEMPDRADLTLRLGPDRAVVE